MARHSALNRRSQKIYQKDEAARLQDRVIFENDRQRLLQRLTTGNRFLRWAAPVAMLLGALGFVEAGGAGIFFGVVFAVGLMGFVVSLALTFAAPSLLDQIEPPSVLQNPARYGRLRRRALAGVAGKDIAPPLVMALEEQKQKVRALWQSLFASSRSH